MKPTAKDYRAAAILCELSAKWFKTDDQPKSAKYMKVAARACRAAARAAKKPKKKESK